MFLRKKQLHCLHRGTMRVVLVLAEGVSWHELLGKDSGCFEVSTITVIRVCWKSWNPHVSVYAWVYIYICIYVCVLFTGVYIYICMYLDMIHMLHDNIHTSYMINCMYNIYIHIYIYMCVCDAFVSMYTDTDFYFDHGLMARYPDCALLGAGRFWERKIIGPNGAFFSKTHTVTYVDRNRMI